jgi:peroxiredoxin
MTHRFSRLFKALVIGAGAVMLIGAKPPAVGDVAPDLQLTLLDGTKVSLADLRGKVVVLNFWATWCVPCREEMPEFVKAQRELGDRGVQFVGIAIDQPDKVDAFAAELQLNYPALVGGYGAIELSKAMGNRLGALPFTVIVNRAGRVAHTQLGPLKDAQLRSILGQLL